MNFIKASVAQPITVAVGVVLSLIAGMVAFQNVPIRMAPEVDSVVISVGTAWENASAEEIESDVIEQQEAYLGDVSNLVSMTSISRSGRGAIRMEFRTGTVIDDAMAEVDQKLSEVPRYPEGVDEPKVEAVDPESVDYIAWVGLSSTDPQFDATTLYDFMDRRMRPAFERIPGISQVGMLGARESETQVIVDPIALAARGLTYQDLIAALDVNNANFSAGRITNGKNDLRVRTVGRFVDAQSVEDLVIRRDADGPIYVRDVASVQTGYKELNDWARARGNLMPFFNFQLVSGGNMLETMEELQSEIAAMNAPGGMLDQYAGILKSDGRMDPDARLELVQTWDSSMYVKDALSLVQSNILVGGLLATVVLLLFLRSARTVGIIAIAIPLSVIGTVVILLSLGRSVNIISLAGMAFAVGMVVDNAIVVIENVFRHLQQGKPPKQAAYEGTQEVGGAVLASTLTTLVVFFPVLMIQEQAGQLFRDIALAIMAAVGLSLVVSLTVIPAAAGVLLRGIRGREKQFSDLRENGLLVALKPRKSGRLRNGLVWISRRLRQLTDLPEITGRLVRFLIAGWTRRIGTVVAFVVTTIIGIVWLMPPLDYLPKGNRNLVFSVLVPPPGYSVDQLFTLGDRIEPTIAPAWEAAGDRFTIETVKRGGQKPSTDGRPQLSLGEAGTVIAPKLDQYFMVAREGRIFQAAIPVDSTKTPDALLLLEQAMGGGAAPDTPFFSFQFPLFRTGGTTGAAIKIDVVGDSLDQVVASAGALMSDLTETYGRSSTNPSPSNFTLPTPEIRVTPDDERLQDAGLTRRDVGLATQASGDGILLPRRFEREGELKDLKIINRDALGDAPVQSMHNAPLATRRDGVVDLASVADVDFIRVQDQIRHVDRQRAVTLELTPPEGVPLASMVQQLHQHVRQLRDAGAISPSVDVRFAGSAGNLAAIQSALVGDGSLVGTVSSSLFLAFVIVYLLMVVLFQSWSYPMVIMISVPLATLGGFIGLSLVHQWTAGDRYLPVQNMDVLTILGFVILAGVVVNNAILIVHQALNFRRSGTDEDGNAVSDDPKEAIVQSVTSRVRPILMSTLTSVGGMLPLVFLTGPGSELYRGLGAVITAGLVVSTVFTMFLVPVVLSMVFDLARPRAVDDASVSQEVMAA
ncbi:efflux RND transporter permease subunit [Roseiconus nitratireducens]|uniref:Efflux RND transporter permease subunit n=1 Tax=Roseiconus nitratireducens TaxID=2605748 RepID=A0A5M6CRJ9_9BACT|nr:efflux RND transporter permease subunit [Roseiconus nitratireducens]KAA5537948.1 efflux RND transporter permease subunit [Roseiconus nitratireducens]